MYTYTAYGLRIASALPMPELLPCNDGRADVTIRFGAVDFAAAGLPTTEEGAHGANGDVYFRWEGVGAFRARAGTEVVIDPAPGAPDQLVRLPVLGPLLATLLHQRGTLVLHASAVAVGDGVVAFVGEKGWGKSTTAAALYARGHRLVTDDAVALELREGAPPLVLPGFPQFKLWPDAASASLGDDPESLPRLSAGQEKRTRRVHHSFVTESLPLRRIYVLSGGEAHAIEPLAPQEMLLQLIRHTWAARYSKIFLHGTETAIHTLRCQQVAQAVPILRLRRPRCLERLSEVVRSIEADLSAEFRDPGDPHVGKSAEGHLCEEEDLAAEAVL